MSLTKFQGNLFGFYLIMGKTRNKLDEACFFLQQLEKNYLEQPGSHYYLSAFISSARSVLWVMRSEYVHVDGWEAWYSSKKPTSKETVLLKRMNAFRVKSEKVEPLESRLRVSFQIPKENLTEEFQQEIIQTLLDNVGKELKVTVSPLDDEPSINKKVEKEKLQFEVEFDRFYRVLDEFDDDDILDVCKDYYGLLDEIVSECEEKFPSIS